MIRRLARRWAPPVTAGNLALNAADALRPPRFFRASLPEGSFPGVHSKWECARRIGSETWREPVPALDDPSLRARLVDRVIAVAPCRKSANLLEELA